MTSPKNISFMHISKELSARQSTAWFMLGSLGDMCGGDMGKLRRIVEVDGTFIGGKERNKPESRKLHAGRGTVGKQAVLGLREVGGRTIAKPIEGTSHDVLHREIAAHIEPGSEIHTDEHSGYDNLPDHIHLYVKHGAGEYVGANGIHVNSVESMWAVLKPGVYGTRHYVSVKHLTHYVDEATFRPNYGNIGMHTLNRLASFLARAFRHHITYRELTA